MPDTLVCMTESDIREGLAGNCHRCPVALATARATGGEVMVFEDGDCRLWIEVDGRGIPAPPVVRDFVRAFDDQPRDIVDGSLDLRDPGCKPPAPIEFTLPDSSDPRWKLQCQYCGCRFDADELDDDGSCEDCRES